MSAPAAAARPGRPPLVAVVARAPLVAEALAGALERVAVVRHFPAGGGDTAGLLRSLGPDAVVVDAEDEAAAATAFARETSSPLVHVSLREPHLRLLAGDGWEDHPGDASAEAIRNLLVGGLFGRRTS